MTSSIPLIRRAEPADAASIHAIHAAAFPTDAEARLVEALRAAGRERVSLVAEVDGVLVGHVAFSLVSVEWAAGGGLGLAPLGVLPAYQRQGIGAALVRVGLAACVPTGAEFVVVLGAPAYYGRFGFTQASAFGLRNEYGADEAFMALALREGGLPAAGGLVRYAPEFAWLELPAFSVRAPVHADAETVNALIVASDTAHTGMGDSVVEDVLSDWDMLNLARDAWVVCAPDGRLAGYARLLAVQSGVRLIFDGYTHPEFRGRGIGTGLVAQAVTRAHEIMGELEPRKEAGDVVPSGAVLHTGVYSTDTAGQALMARAGFVAVRHFWRMMLTLSEAPAEPALPEGLTLRACDPEHDLFALYTLVNDAFADHWPGTRRTFEAWRAHLCAHADYDPALWLMAWDGATPVGAALCFAYSDIGFVRTLAVRADWRGRGLGFALLRRGFAALWARGRAQIGLDVDAHNTTGATRLYERAGMHVAWQNDAYELRL